MFDLLFARNSKFLPVMIIRNKLRQSGSDITNCLHSLLSKPDLSPQHRKVRTSHRAGNSNSTQSRAWLTLHVDATMIVCSKFYEWTTPVSIIPKHNWCSNTKNNKNKYYKWKRKIRENRRIEINSRKVKSRNNNVNVKNAWSMYANTSLRLKKKIIYEILNKMKWMLWILHYLKFNNLWPWAFFMNQQTNMYETHSIHY